MDELTVLAHCFDCNKAHDVSETDESDYGMTCIDCGGTVISRTGKMRFRLIDARSGEVPV